MRIVCSSCEKSLNVQDHLLGKQIRCPGCQRLIVVGNKKTALSRDAVAPKKTNLGKVAGKKTTLARDVEPDREAIAERKKVPPVRSRNHEEDDDRPRSARERERERSRSDRPRRRDQADKPFPWVLVGSIGGGVLAVLAVVLIIVLNSGGSTPSDPKADALKLAEQKKKVETKFQENEKDNGGPDNKGNKEQKDKEEIVKKKENPKEEIVKKEETPKKEEIVKKEETPKKEEIVKKEDPLGPVPAEIADETLSKVEKATAYVKVTFAKGSATGSGFFAVEPGLVLTNAHVLGMVNSTEKPSKVEVVVNSGLKDEYKVLAEILGVDQETDLAVVRIQGDASRVPVPLRVDFDNPPKKLRKVYVLGFPYGEDLGKNVTVSQSVVSSLREDQIQLSGQMDPGNSGGPIVDARGVVVGVAVAGIKGSNINFAVPAERIRGLLNGRVQRTQLGEPFRDQQKIKLPLRLTCLDPLERIQEVRLDVWSGPKGPARPASQKEPTPLAGDAPKMTHPMIYKQGLASHDLPLATLPDGHVYWIQPMMVSRTGARFWAPATHIEPSDAPPLERIPANLTYQPDVHPERSLKLESKYEWTMSLGKKKKEKAEKLDLEVLETVGKSADPKRPTGTQVKLRIGKGIFTLELDRFKKSRDATAQAMVRGHVYPFMVDPSGKLMGFSAVTFQHPSAFTKFEADDLAEFVSNAFEITCMPLPSKEVKPMEKWESKASMLVPGDGGKKRKINDLFMQCTYEGTRNGKDSTEALIRFSGEVKVRNYAPPPGAPKNLVSGEGLFDVKRGFFSKFKVAIRTDVEDEGILFTRIFESSITRVPGNVFGINSKPPDIVVKKDPPPDPDLKVDLTKGPPPGWKEVKGGFKKEAYSVWMPADGKISESEDSIVPPKVGQIRLFRTFCLRKDGSLFAAGQIILPPTLVKESPKVRQDLFKNMFLTEVKGKLVETKNVRLGTMAGKEYVAETPDGMARYRLIGTGVQIYRLLVVGSKDQVMSRDTDLFFESFQRKIPGGGNPKKDPEPEVKKQPDPPINSGPADPEAVKKLQGLWILEIAKGQNWYISGEEALLFEKNNILWVKKDGKIPVNCPRVDFTLDPKDGKNLDCKISRGIGNGATYLVIYKIEGDTLTIATDGGTYAAPNPPTRPSNFTNAKHVRVYKRGKIPGGGDPKKDPEPELKKQPDPPIADDSQFSKQFLSDMKEFEVRVGFGQFGKGGNLGYRDSVRKNSLVNFNETNPPNSLSMHAVSFGYSTVKYRLDRKSAYFKSTLGLHQSKEEPKTALTFEVLGDGKSLWKSKAIKGQRETDECFVDVSKVEVLELRVNCPGDFHAARAIWLDPHLLSIASGR